MNNAIQQFLSSSNSLFEVMVDNCNDYIYIWDFRTGDYVVSENFARDFSIDLEGTQFPNSWHSFIDPRDLTRVEDTVELGIADKKSNVKLEYQVINPTGRVVWLSDKFRVFYDEKSGTPSIIVGAMHNLSLDSSADNITGLLRYDKCKEMFDSASNCGLGKSSSIMLLGIDEFATINTLNNRAFGDMVLRETALAFSNFLPEGFSIYRYDGDQFLIVVEDGSKKDLVVLYKKLKNYVSSPHKIQGKSYRFTISAGIASYPEDGTTWADIEKSVAIALKKAKETGKNNCVEFTNTMFVEKLYEQSLVHSFSEDVEQNFRGFRVVFQPVCCAKNLKVKGAEILLRYTTSSGEALRPDRFIPLLEQTQLILPVGLWVLEQAICVCKKWIQYIEDFVMNVNVSFLQLRDSSFCDKVERLLQKYELPVRHLTLELTESYFITDAPNINASLQRLRALHLQVAMDDFGTGYSSLARLSEFNVDVVKIDRSFVQSLHRSRYNHDFIDSVIRLCHNVGMKVCVEGVETRNEQEIICLLNADFVQGFYVSKPISEDFFFAAYIENLNANESLIVVPNVQLRNNQIVSDRDVLYALMEATPLGLSFWSRELEVIACNSEVLYLFEADNFEDFKENFYEFSPVKQPDGRYSVQKAEELLQQAFLGNNVKVYWQHCNRAGDEIPTEVSFTKISYMGDYIVASYTRDMREQKRMEDKIEKFNIRLRAILDATPLCLNLWNSKFENIMCNKAAVNLFNLGSEAEYMERFFELSPKYQPDGSLSNKKALLHIQNAFANGREQFEWEHKKLTGEKIPAEITLVKIEGLGEDGSDLIAGYTRDLREQLRNQKIQETINMRIRAVLDSSPLACILWTLDLTIVDCNQVAVNMFGAKHKKDVMQHFDSFLPKTQPDGENSLLKKEKIFAEILMKKHLVFEWIYVNQRKEEFPCEVTLVRIPLEHEELIVAYNRDLRELYQTLELNNRLSQMAHFDLLTGVVSRARFVENLEKMFDPRSQVETLALLIFDIDYFKSINDTYGHPIGDTVLKEVTKTIEKCLPIHSVFGRFGGDEFVISIQDISKTELTAFMEEAVQRISTLNFESEHGTFSTSISIGSSFKLPEDLSYHQLLNRADKALYEAKANGRNGCAIL